MDQHTGLGRLVAVPFVFWIASDANRPFVFADANFAPAL